jgi:hypothetical protein
MVPDAEVLYIACEALTALDIGEFTIKVGPPFPFPHQPFPLADSKFTHFYVTRACARQSSAEPPKDP